MKLLINLAFAALMVGNASATTYYVVGTCGTFSEPPSTTPANSGSGTFVCPTAASLGVTGSLTVASEFVDYDSDYSSGLSTTVTTVTNWTFTGATFAWGADTTTVTGTGGSNSYTSTQGASLNPLTNLPPIVLAGFYDNVSAFGTPTISWTTQATVGSAVAGTGYAEVIYDYNVISGGSGTPEPVSMLLLGTGLAAIFLLRTRRFRRFFSKA
jgi:hypothetical protein